MKRFAFWSFVALMLGLMALFIRLGFWQVERLGEKEALIARVAERVDAAPVPFPPPRQWPELAPEALEYTSVTATGTFRHDLSVLVFTALSEPRGRFSGPGYWIVTPLLLEGGGSLLVNRGFVPQGQEDALRSGPSSPAGVVNIAGVLRQSEDANWFSPAPDPVRRIASVRSVEAIVPMLPPELLPVAPMTLDLPAGPEGALPQGGETVMRFSNNHLGYAITWFGFAALVPGLLFAWIRQQRRAGREVGAA